MLFRSVSASTGALLLPHLPASVRPDLLLACAGMFGISLVAAALVIGRLWGRLTTHGIGPARTVPTLWIVLGPVGQSITAAHLMAGARHGQAALLYGVPALGFALFWIALAAALTVRTARTGLPFSLTWWSFTFPVGTVVTGTSGLAARTGSPSLTVLAVLLFAGLAAAWATVAVRTARGVATGTL